jgi:hypothetical protein
VKTLLVLTFLFVASLASAQTFNAYLPDVPLINYSGDHSYYQVWINWTPRTSTGLIGNVAQCSAPGLWGSPGTYQGYWIGGALGYHTTLPQACGPITVNINAAELSENQYGYPDHLYQGLAIWMQGSLPNGPGGPPRRGVLTQYEACSLVGDDDVVGQGHEVAFDAGNCNYYGGNSAPA